MTEVSVPEPTVGKLSAKKIFGFVVAALGIASVAVPKLAVAAMMLGLIAYLVQDKESRRVRLALMIAAPLIFVGMVRFTMSDGVQGIVTAGQVASTKSAIYALREIRFTEDIMREQAIWDPDGDGIGSAGLVTEISGRVLLRGQKQAPPGLMQRFRQLAEGPYGTFVVHQGYGIIVYLPTPDGKATAQPGEPVDDERAERRYVAYAWPMNAGDGERSVIYVDEHDRVWLSDNVLQGYAGIEKMPAWDAALPSSSVDTFPTGLPGSESLGQDGAVWRPWKGKQARAELPGDKSPVVGE